MGNIMPHEFKRYYGFKLSDEHLEFFRKTHQSHANHYSLEAREWHFFDIPRVLVCGSKALADELIAILREYTIRGQIEVTWYEEPTK